MKVAIHQPQYLPWPPYIHKVMSSDLFVYLDTVQYSTGHGRNAGIQNRNQVKTARNATWLTIPVKHKLEQTIRDTKISDIKAVRKHWNVVAASYGETDGFKRWNEELYSLLHMDTDSLCEIAIASTEWLLEKLGVETVRMRASDILEAKGHGSSLVASICQSLGATTYLTGSGAESYMKREDFDGVSCEVWMQDCQPLEYPQAYPELGFTPNLSTLDLLLNCPDTALQSIKSSGSWRLMWEAT
jgi:hypothetical protein